MWYKYALKYAYAALTIKGSILAAMTGNQEIAKSLDTIFSNPKHRLHEDYKKVLLQMYLNKELNIYTDDSVDIEIEEKTSEDTFVDTFLMSEAIYIIIYSLYIYAAQYGPISAKDKIFSMKNKRFDKVAIHLRDTDLIWEIICNDPRFKELKDISVDIVSSGPLTCYSELDYVKIHVPKWFQKYLISKVPKEIPFLHFDTGFEGSIPRWMAKNGWNVADIKLVSAENKKKGYLLPLYKIDLNSKNENLEFNHSFVINNLEHVPHRLEHTEVNMLKQRDLLSIIKLTKKDSLIFKLMHETNNSEERVFYKLVDMARKKYGFNNETAKKHIYQALLKTDASNFNIGEAIKAIKSSYQAVVEKLQAFVNNRINIYDNNNNNDDDNGNNNNDNNNNNDDSEQVVIDSKELNRLIKPILDMDMQDINISWLELDDEETDIMDPDLFNKITFRYSKNMPAFWASYFITKEYFDIQREIANDFETKYQDLEKDSENNEITIAFYNKLKEHLEKYFPDFDRVKHLISLIKEKNETTYIPLNNNSNILIRETLIKSMKEAMKKKPEPNVFVKTVEILKHHSLKIPRFIIRAYNKSKSSLGKKRLEPLLKNLTIENIVEKNFVNKLSKKDQDLINAIIVEDIEKIKTALMNGASVNSFILYREDGDENWKEYPILSYAIIENQLPIVKLLIDSGANVNQANKYGESPLCLAVSLDNREIAELLIKNGADMYHNFNTNNINVIEQMISSDNLEMLKLFMENGLDLNTTDKQGDSLLGMAARHSSLKIVKFLLDNGANMYHNFGNYKYTDVIENIISHDNVEVLKLFIENGLDINTTNPQGNSLLGIAVKHSSFEIAEFLLKNGADMYYNFDGELFNNSNVINCIISYDNLRMLKLFIENGLDINATNSKGESLLKMAIYHSNLRIIEFLLENGVSIYYESSNLEDPTFVNYCRDEINFVISRNDLKMLKLFMENGLNVNAINSKGESLLKMAIKYLHPTIVEFLLENGADMYYNFDVDDSKFDNSSERFVALDSINVINYMIYRDNLEILELFIKHGLDLNTINSKGDSLLKIAIKYSSSEIIEFLLKNGADMYYNFDVDNDTNIIKYMISFDDPEIFELFVKNNLNLNAKNSKGESLLEMAIKQFSFQIVEFLLDNNIKIDFNFDFDIDDNIIDKMISYGSVKIFKLFIKNGLDLNATNSEGESLLEIAIKHNSFRIIKFLLKNGINYNFDINKDMNLIHSVITNDDLEIFKILIKNGLDLNAINSDGESLLEMATKCRSSRIVKFLLDNGVNMYHNFNNDKCRSAIEWAICKDDLRIFYAFVENGLDLNITNAKGESLFTMAVKHSTYHIAKFLLDKLNNNVNIYQFDKGLGTSPLEFVISNDSDYTFQLFVEEGLLDIKGPQINSLIKMVIDNFSVRILYFLIVSGVDISEKALGYDILSYLAKQPYSLSKKMLEFLINQRIGNRDLALQTAAIYNNEEAGKLFLENKANPNSIDESGETPLHHTCRNNNLDFSRLLINYGANPNIQNKFGYTALGIVIDSHRNAELIRMLLEAGADPNIGPPGKEPIKFIKEYYGE